MSGIKEKGLFQRAKEEAASLKEHFKGADLGQMFGSQHAGSLNNAEQMSREYGSGVSVQNTDDYLNTSSERYQDRLANNFLVEEHRKEQVEKLKLQKKTILEKEKEAAAIQAEIDKASKPIQDKIKAIEKDSKNQLPLSGNNPLDPTGTSKINNANTALTVEAQRKIEELLQLQKDSTAGLAGNLKSLKDENLELSKNIINDSAYLDAVSEFRRLEEKFGVLGGATNKESQKIFNDHLNKGKENDNVVSQFLSGASNYINESKAGMADWLINMTSAVVSPESRMDKASQKKYTELRQTIQAVEKPVMQKYAEEYSNLLKQSEAHFNENIEKEAKNLSLLESQMLRWEARHSTMALERALEKAQDYLEGRSGTGILAREILAKNLLSQYGPVEDIQRGLGDFFFKDALIEKHDAHLRGKGPALSKIEMANLTNLALAEDVENYLGDKMGFGYKTVVGTGESIGFIRDMALGEAIVGVGGRAVSSTARLAGQSGRISARLQGFKAGLHVLKNGEKFAALSKLTNLNTGALAKVVGGTTQGAIQGGLQAGKLSLQAAATTYINPANINANKDNLGSQIIRDEEGNIKDVLFRESLRKYMREEIESSKIIMKAAVKDLSAVGDRSEEEEQQLQYFKARLGEIEIDGVTPISEELEMYSEENAPSVFKSHLKGVASTGVEILSELYSKHIFKGLGWVGKKGVGLVPGGTKVLERVTTGTAKFANKLETEFLSTSFGRGYKNWQAAVSKFNINDTKVIGSVFEEIPEEYVAAVGNSLLDWDATELKHTLSVDGAVDIGAQTLLMNSLFGVAGNVSMHSKLGYNALHNLKIDKLNARIAEVEEFAKKNPDQDLSTSLSALRKEKSEISKNGSGITGYGLTGKILGGAKTAFSGTKQYVEDRKKVREVVDKLRAASTDQDINDTIDLISLGEGAELVKGKAIATLRAKGKKEAADLLEKSLVRGVVFGAFNSNTQEELLGALNKALKTPGITPDKGKQLLLMKDTVERMEKLREKYEGHENVSEILRLSYDKDSGKMNMEDVKQNLLNISDEVREEIDAFKDTNGFDDVDYSLDTLDTRTFSDPAQQARYNEFLSKLRGYKSNLVGTYIRGLDTIELTKKNINKAAVALNELIFPSLEKKNSEGFLKELMENADAIKKGENPLGLKNVKFDKDGKLNLTLALQKEMYDVLRDKWVGSVNKGKISLGAFNKMKATALDNFRRQKQVEKGFLDTMLAAQLVAEEKALAEQQKAENTSNENLDDEVTTPVVVETVVYDGDGAEAFHEASEDFLDELDDLDLGANFEDNGKTSFSFGENTNGSATTSSDNEDNDGLPTADNPEFLNIDDDDIEWSLSEEDSFTPEQIAVLKGNMKKLAEIVFNATGKNPTFTEVMQELYRTVGDKDKLKKYFRGFVKGWTENNYAFQEGEVMTVYKAFFAVEQEIKGYFDAMVSVFEEKMDTKSQSSPAQEREEVEELSKKLGNEGETVTGGISPENLPEVASKQEDPNKAASVIPRLGFSAMPNTQMVDDKGVAYKDDVSQDLSLTEDDELTLRVDFKDLLHPDKNPSGSPMKVAISEEKDWGRIEITIGRDENHKPLLGTFKEWVATKEKENPNFRNTQEFRDKIPMYVTDLSGKRLAYVHDTDWYNRYNVGAPDGVNKPLSTPDKAWDHFIERGQDSTRDLRESILAGLTDITIEYEDNGVFHTIPEGQPALTLRESNPQGQTVVQRGINKGRLEGLDPGFKKGTKILLNDPGDFNSSTKGHTWNIVRVGLKMGPTGKMVETYRALPVLRRIQQKQYDTAKWAIAVHKVLQGATVPAEFGMTKEDAMDNYVKPILKQTGIDISTYEGLNKYLRHFVRLSGEATASFNASRKAYSEKQQKEYKEVSSYSAAPLIYYIFESKLPYSKLVEKEILEPNVSMEGINRNAVVPVLSREGVSAPKDEGGNSLTYGEYIRESLTTSVKCFNFANKGEAPVYGLTIQPVINIKYTPISATQNRENLSKEIEESTKETAQKVEATQEAVKTETDYTEKIEAAKKALEELGVDINSFREDDYLFGDLEVLDELFNLTGDLDIFQEKIVTDHIATLIMLETNSKSKVSIEDLESIKQKIRGDFRGNLKVLHDQLESIVEELKDAKGEEAEVLKRAYNQTLNNIISVRNNFETLFDKALEEASSQTGMDFKGVKHDKRKSEEEIKQEEENENEENTLSERDYSKDSVEEQIKTKSSVSLKKLFFNIPQRDSKDNLKKGYLGFPRYMSLNDIYNQVLKVISTGVDPGSSYTELIARLKESDSPYMIEVVKRLEAADEQLQNEFTVNVVAHSLTSKFAMYEQSTQGITLKLYDTNANEITTIIKNIWQEKAKASELFDYNGKINVNYVKELLEEFENFPKDVNELSNEMLEKVRNWVAKLGVEFHDKTWETIVNEGYYNAGQDWNFEDFYADKDGGLLPNLAKYLKDALTTPENYSMDTGITPITDLVGVTNALSTIEANYNPQLVSLSFRDSGKNISTLTPPKYVTDMVANLLRDLEGGSELIDKLKSLSFSEDSLILHALKDIPAFKTMFKVHHVAITAVKERGTKSFGNSDITSLGDLDYDLAVLTGFQDRKVAKLPSGTMKDGFNLRVANMLFPTMSDKSTGLYLTTPVYDFLASSKIAFEDTGDGHKLSITVKELLYNQLVLPELKRIFKFHNEVKATNVKGYDEAAALFHLLPIMNTVKDASGMNIIEVLAKHPMSFELVEEKYKKSFMEAVEGVVMKEVNLKKKDWKEQTADTEEGNKVSAMFDAKYFKEVDMDPSKDYELGVFDYVLNSMLFNAEVFKVFAGDVSMYGQDKVLTKHVNAANKKDGNVDLKDEALGRSTTSLEDEDYVSINRQIGTNLGKRLALLVAPGKKLANSRGESYNQIFLKDSVDISENSSFLIRMYYGEDAQKEAEPLLKEYRKIYNYVKNKGQKEQVSPATLDKLAKFQSRLKEIRETLSKTYTDIGDYFDIESTDAQEYTTAKEHLNVLRRLGRISKEQEKIINAVLAEGKDLTKEQLRIVLQPIKPVHTGAYVNEKWDMNRVIYVKSSSFPLIPQLTRDNGLDNLRKKMEQLEERTGRFTRASYQTANKVGSVVDANALDPFDNTDLDRMFNGLEEGGTEFDPANLDSSVAVLSRDNFRIQQDVPFKSDKKKKDEVAMGTQIFKLLFGNGVLDLNNETEMFPFKGKMLTGKALYEEYKSSFSKIVNTKKVELFRELGLSDQGKIEDEKRYMNNLQSLLEKEAISRGYSLKSIRGLTISELAHAAGYNYYEFKTPLWMSADSNRYESLLNSIVTNRVMKHKMPGNGFVAGSESGFRMKEDLSEVDSSRIIYMDSWNGKELQGVHTTDSENGVTFHKAQVFIPSKFKGSDDTLIDLFDGYDEKTGKGTYIERRANGTLKLKGGMVASELFNMFSFRTPTSSHVSGSSIEIAGILPPESGDLMIVPKNFTKQKGLDYDVDKESAYQLNHTQDKRTGKIQVLSEKHLERELQEFDRIIEDLELQTTTLEIKGKKFTFEDLSDKAPKELTPELLERLKTSFYTRFTEILGDSVSEEDLEILLDPISSVVEKRDKKKLALERKIAENDFIRTHLAVYNSPNLDIQRKINRVLSMDFARDQAKMFEEALEKGNKAAFIREYLVDNTGATREEATKAYKESLMNFTMLSYNYQKAKMSLGSVGKVAIGVYANYTTFAGLIQQTFGEQGMSIVNKHTGEPKIMKIGHFTSSSVGGLQTLKPGSSFKKEDTVNRRSVSDTFEEKGNTATDNEKEQILGRVGVNEDTINVDAMISLRQFDADENGNSISYLLLSQPAVKEYIKTLKSSKGVLGKYTTKETLIDTMIKSLSEGKISYGKDSFTGEFQFYADSKILDWHGSEKLTGDALLEGVESQGANEEIQLEALMTFVELQKEAQVMTGVQKVINTNTLGKSIIESMTKNEGLAKLSDNKMFPNAIEILGEVSKKPKEGYYKFSYAAKDAKGNDITRTNFIKPTTPQGEIVINGLYLGNTLYSRFFPFKEEGLKTVLSEIFATQGVPSSDSAHIEELETILEEVKKYFNSNKGLGIYQGDSQAKRHELLVDEEGNTSLAAYLMDARGSSSPQYSRGKEAIRNNPLIQKLMFEIGKGEDALSVIKYNNAATDNLDERSLYNSLPELVKQNLPLPPKNGKPYSTRQLVEDLVAYSFLEGGVQEATQFSKFIPIELLASMGQISAKGKFISVSRGLQGYNPHRGTKGENFKRFLGIDGEGVGNVSLFTKQYFQHKPEKAKTVSWKEVNFLASKEENVAERISLKEASDAVFVNIKGEDKKMRLFMHTGNNIYAEIPILKTKGTSQYEYGNRNVVPLKKAATLPPVKTPVVKGTTTSPITIGEGSTIESVMKQISEANFPDSHKHLSALAKWLLPMVKSGTVLKLEDMAAMGLTDHNLNITLKSKYGKPGASQTELALTMVHEFIHHVTMKELKGYYDIASGYTELQEDSNAPQYVKDLHAVFLKYRENLDPEQLSTMTENLKIAKDKSLPKAKRDEAIQAIQNHPERATYYAGINIKEFLAMTLTEKDIQEKLSGMSHLGTDKSVFERIKEILTEFFKEAFPSIKEDTLAMDALKASMAFIQEEYNIRNPNSFISLPSTSKESQIQSKLDEGAKYTAQDESNASETNDSEESYDPEEWNDDGTKKNGDPTSFGFLVGDVDYSDIVTDSGSLLEEIGISEEEWNSLSVEEKQKIKECN